MVTNGKSGKVEVGNEVQSTIHKINTLQGYIVPNRNIANIYNNSKWSIICKYSISLCCTPETKITLTVNQLCFNIIQRVRGAVRRL